MSCKKMIAIWVIALISIARLSAHESRPLYIQVSETSENTFSLKLNIPNTVAADNLPLIIFPAGIHNLSGLVTTRNAGGFTQTGNFESEEEGIPGKSFGIQFPKFNPAVTTIVQVGLMEGTVHTFVMGPNEKEFLIPTLPSAWAVIGEYSWLGITHIWAGIDHLLFLVCLLIIAGFSKKLVWTITGFTLAHSITLIASTLGWLALPIRPVEACIALSIIFLCYEIVHHHHTKSSLTYRYPFLVSSSFGLLHGFGFASVLGLIGLPHNHLINALLFFNVGVELGQLIFLSVVWVAYWLLIRVVFSQYLFFKNATFKLAIYSVGILASFWFFQRIL